MVDNVIGKIELRLVYDNHRLDTRGPATDGEVTLDISYIVMGSVKGLLHDRICVALDAVDEAFLGNRREALDCIGPKPKRILAAHGLSNGRTSLATYWRVTSPPTHSPSGRGLWGLRRASIIESA